MKTTFYNYLLSNRKNLQTSRIYDNQVTAYLLWMQEQQITKHSYNHLLSYIEHCQSQGNQVKTIQKRISILKQYFTYLQLKENPAEAITLKGITRNVPTQALSKKQLENIYHNYTGRGLTGKRNKILLGFMVYQALSPLDLGRLEVENLDLKKAQLYVPGSKNKNERTLDLNACQLLELQDYLLKIRGVILQESVYPYTQKLIVTRGRSKGNHAIRNPIQSMITDLRRIEPTLVGALHIRLSRINHWIKEHGLRQTQYNAGHKYVSSTERYKTSHFEALKDKLNQHHPF